MKTLRVHVEVTIQDTPDSGRRVTAFYAVIEPNDIAKLGQIVQDICEGVRAANTDYGKRDE